LTGNCASIERDLECPAGLNAAGCVATNELQQTHRGAGLREGDWDGVNTPPVTKKVEPSKKPDFERSLARLEEVVRRLESPQLSLDEAMKLFEEGVELSRECQKQLEEAEGRVEILLKKTDGKMTAQPFDPEPEAES
jgi:exodeoxyribonuclease VII small subunit